MTMRRLLLVSVPVLAAVLALFFYLTGERYVETENAYLKTDKVMIAPEVSAAVVRVAVAENEAVQKGQTLFLLDTALFTAARDGAKAKLEKTRTDIEALQAAYRSKQAELGLANTKLAFAEKEYRRAADLVGQHFVSQVQLDERRQDLDLARQQLVVLQQDIARVLASLNGQADAPVEQYPAYQEAEADLAKVNINIEHTTVSAPFAGVVSNVPKLGQHLNAGSPAMVLVADTTPWIEANFNETDLTFVQPAQAVSIRIDTYPDRRWTGRVVSISPASGAEFSILPAQNASGNWVKVVQRITVRIALDAEQNAPALRAGMSANVEIDTGKNRWQRLFHHV